VHIQEHNLNDYKEKNLKWKKYAPMLALLGGKVSFVKALQWLFPSDSPWSKTVLDPKWYVMQEC
jgi:hypothetical protein